MDDPAGENLHLENSMIEVLGLSDCKRILAASEVYIYGIEEVIISSSDNIEGDLKKDCDLLLSIKSLI